MEKNTIRLGGLIFQVLVWIFLILSIISGAVSKGEGKDRDNKVFGNNDSDVAIYALYVIIYVTYLIIEFCSTTYNYLVNKLTNEAIYDRMQRIFSTHPEIILHCECYHYQLRRTREGRNYKEIVNTYREDFLSLL